ncbi:MAG: glycosyltransferase [Rhizobiaceae bacterium]|nr:glycosyltransferase [Rhizobiaceae bacterium]
MISIIVPHLEQEDQLRRCLTSLAQQQGVSQPVEIFVVDNGSKRMPEGVCKEFANVTLLQERTPGPGPARNLGISKAKGEILAFIDADCIADPHWLSVIEQRFAEDRDLNILGGDVRIAMQDPERPSLAEAYESVYAFRMKEYIAKQGFTATCNLAMRAEVFARVGEFGGINIAEDRDWGQRALALGLRTVFCPEMLIYHPARKNLTELGVKWQRITAHDFAKAQSKSFWRARWILRGLAIAASPVAEVLKIGFTDRLTGLRARVRAFAGLIYIRLYRASLILSLAFGADAATYYGRWNRG